VPALEKSGLTQTEVAERFPALTALDRDWVHILNDMTPMIGAMSDNVTNYQAIASLPPFPLFPWFFVIPGVLVAGLAVAAGARREHPLRSGLPLGADRTEREPDAPVSRTVVVPSTVPKGAS
jgi:hypothetical protein